jgi:8-oxo-dGTP pyrophosphatase MutT (NUDIX family)
MSTKYVCGFLLDSDKKLGLFISKNRGPDHVIGKKCGIGGRINPGESPSSAMVREFLEETGVVTQLKDWTYEAFLTGEDFLVHFFSACNNDYLGKVLSQTDETLCVHPLYLVFQEREYFVRDHPLILSLILDESNIFKPVAFYTKDSL